MNIVATAKRLGADLAGVASIEAIGQGGVHIDEGLLPGARSVIAIGVGQRRAALLSADIAMAQHDTLNAYDGVSRVGHALSKHLADAGHEALTVPAFVPLDMRDGRQGMVGAVDLRGVAVLAGLGWYGQSALLVTARYGPRVRLAAVVTTADIEATPAATSPACPGGCRTCLDACPAGALPGGGRVDKTACGRVVFKYGLRGLLRFARELSTANPAEREELLRGRAMRELWQTFVSGIYYSCFRCQAVCPVGGP